MPEKPNIVETLSVLAIERWHSLGGAGAPPDQATIHSDCIDDILSEYFEGEPEIGPDGEACVRFKSTLARLFYVSQIWTEYDPDNRSWKTFYAKRLAIFRTALAPVMRMDPLYQRVI